MSIELTSPAFHNRGTIPKRFTCSGEDVSPPLEWRGVGNARELTLLVEDIDADRFVHWIVLGIPRDVDHFAAGRSGWKGPCPPEGDPPHRYVFSLYATDEKLGLDSNASPDEVHAAIDEHAVAAGKLFGRFGR